jgi:predicted MFS family arabinose efflux permease
MERKTGSRLELLKGNFVLLVMSSFLFVMSGYLLVPMFPIYLIEFGALESEVGFIVGLFPLTAVFARIPVGIFIDRRGRIMMLLLGILLNASSPFLYTFCTEIPHFMVVGMLNGLGFAAYTVTAMTMVVDLSPRGRLGEVIGIYAICLLGAQSIGPSISGLLFSSIGFQSTFYIAGVIGLTAAFLALRIKVPSRIPTEGLVGGFSKVVRNRNLITASFAMTLLMIPHGLLLTFLPLYAIGMGIGPEGVGLYYTVYALSMGGVRPFIGMLSDRIGRIAVAVPFALFAAVGVVCFSFVGDLAGILAAGVMFGVGLGSAHSTLSALSVDTMDPKLRGQAIAIGGSAVELGISIGAMGMGSVIMFVGYGTTFTYAATILAIGIIAFLIIRLVWKKEERIYT